MSARRTPKLLNRVEQEIAAGRLWRARELLRAGIQSYEPELFERYGRVLLAMHDIKEAGKWLFLSGRRSPEYRDAIATFLEWCGRRGGKKLYGSFPACARLGPPDRYPEPLAGELVAAGVPADVPPSSQYAKAAPFEGGWPGAVGCAAVVLFLLLSFGVGVVTVLKWLWQSVRCLVGLG
jgi:hypothetical protein